MTEANGYEQLAQSYYILEMVTISAALPLDAARPASRRRV